MNLVCLLCIYHQQRSAGEGLTPGICTTTFTNLPSTPPPPPTPPNPRTISLFTKSYMVLYYPASCPHMCRGHPPGMAVDISALRDHFCRYILFYLYILILKVMKMLAVLMILVQKFLCCCLPPQRPHPWFLKNLESF